MKAQAIMDVPIKSILIITSTLTSSLITLIINYLTKKNSNVQEGTYDERGHPIRSVQKWEEASNYNVKRNEQNLKAIILLSKFLFFSEDQRIGSRGQNFCHNSTLIRVGYLHFEDRGRPKAKKLILNLTFEDRVGSGRASTRWLGL